VPAVVAPHTTHNRLPFLLHCNLLQEWVELAVPGVALCLEYLLTTLISMALLLHCWFDGSAWPRQNALLWLCANAFAWARHSPSLIAYVVGVYADYNEMGASFWRLALAAMLDVLYALVGLGLTALASCCTKAVGENGASLAQAALGLRLVKEVQQQVELEALPASRRSLGATPARMSAAAALH
jgi:hypothetical protein